jgi:N-acetylglucosaminyldiphosphoundecaprenol N-acetyl-beta-D-mannosaminyltransferase
MTNPHLPHADAPQTPIPSHDLIGLQVEYVAAPAAISLILDWALSGTGGYVVVCNVHQVMLAAQDPEFRKVFEGARLRLPDSMVLQKARTFLHGPPALETLLGSRLTEQLCAKAAARGVAIGLYGAKQSTVSTISAVLLAASPALKLVHQESPPFRPLTDEEVAASCATIRAAGVQLLFVSMGCPKQETWMARARPLLPDVVMIGVGAAFDTIAGVVPAAPAWVHRSGLEWAYRLSREPRRLFQRYITTSPPFLLRVVSQKLRTTS